MSDEAVKGRVALFMQRRQNTTWLAKHSPFSPYEIEAALSLVADDVNLVIASINRAQLHGVTLGAALEAELDERIAERAREDEWRKGLCLWINRWTGYRIFNPNGQVNGPDEVVAQMLIEIYKGSATIRA